jgi:hypothetical protein
MITLVQRQPLQMLAMLEDASIDACVTMLPPLGSQDPGRYILDVGEVFQEVRRVLAPGGFIRVGVLDCAATPPSSIVTLTSDELEWLSELAHKRNDPKMAAGVPNYKIDPNKKDFDIHHMGIKAEYAVAKYLGLELDTTFSLHGDDHRGDLIHHDGRTISVKFRTSRGWDFALTRDKLSEFRADLGVLVWPAPSRRRDTSGCERFEIVGFVSREAFAECAVAKDFGYGPRLVLEAQHFLPIHGLSQGPEILMGLPFRVVAHLQNIGLPLVSYNATVGGSEFVFGGHPQLKLGANVVDPYTETRRAYTYGPIANYIGAAPDLDIIQHIQACVSSVEIEIIP